MIFLRHNRGDRMSYSKYLIKFKKSLKNMENAYYDHFWHFDLLEDER